MWKANKESCHTLSLHFKCVSVLLWKDYLLVLSLEVTFKIQPVIHSRVQMVLCGRHVPLAVVCPDLLLPPCTRVAHFMVLSGFMCYVMHMSRRQVMAGLLHGS